jgi:hypothetical protein
MISDTRLDGKLGQVIVTVPNLLQTDSIASEI